MSRTTSFRPVAAGRRLAATIRLLGALSLSLAAGVSHAQDYPNKPLQLLAGTTSDQVTFAAFGGQLRYDAVTDFVPVAFMVNGYPVLLVSPATGIKSIPELVAYVRARPEGLGCSTGGRASQSHLACV
jgi:tripartite-type tricarboxylate transporter receptor subunit TctC